MYTKKQPQKIHKKAERNMQKGCATKTCQKVKPKWYLKILCQKGKPKILAKKICQTFTPKKIN